MAEVLGPAGYNTAFYGKSHMGDIEESYMSRQGFDEAVWSSYNQFPVIYGPGAEIAGGVSPTTTNPEIYPHDPYDMDPGWRTTDHPALLAGEMNGPVRELVTSGDIEGWYREMEVNKDRRLAFIDKSVEEGKPFYIAHWPQMIAFVPYPKRKTPL